MGILVLIAACILGCSLIFLEWYISKRNLPFGFLDGIFGGMLLVLIALIVLVLALAP